MPRFSGGACVLRGSSWDVRICTHTAECIEPLVFKLNINYKRRSLTGTEWCLAARASAWEPTMDLNLREKYRKTKLRTKNENKTSDRKNIKKDISRAPCPHFQFHVYIIILKITYCLWIWNWNFSVLFVFAVIVLCCCFVLFCFFCFFLSFISCYSSDE